MRHITAQGGQYFSDGRNLRQQLCRYITRPAIANERLSITRDGQVTLKLKIIAVIEEPAVIARILTHLGLAAQPPPRAPARRVDLFQAA